MIDLFRANWPAAEAAIIKALGNEIRRLRESAKLSREQMIAQMGSDIHPQTLATYEQGTRQCTMQRLVEICRALHASAPDVLWMALRRAEIDLSMIDIQVDLNAVIRDKRGETAALRGWARKRLKALPAGDGVATIGQSAIPELAILLDYEETEFEIYLMDFLVKPAA